MDMTSTDRIREQMDAIGARDIAQIRASTITGGPACADCGRNTVHGRTVMGRRVCRDTGTCAEVAGELSAAIARSLASGVLTDAGEWMARELGAQHGAEDTAPYGDLDDAGSGDLMTELGETSDTTEDNYGYRVGLLDAYRDAWEKAAGRFYPIGE
jgi:hypothetical protein